MAEKKAKTEKKAVVEAAATEKKASTTRRILRSRDGLVVSDKMEKTVIVAITRQVRHPVYGKYIRRTKRYYAHDSKNICSVGDRVRIVETRPISRHTHWRIEEVLVKATVV